MPVLRAPAPVRPAVAELADADLDDVLAGSPSSTSPRTGVPLVGPA
jgi:hypothetical protein